MYDSHVISILTLYYLDKSNNRLYHGRWDTWLISKNYMDEYFYLMLKTDNQLRRLLDKAMEEAQILEISPLHKAMKE